MSTVVFDLDGTLADTSGDLIAAANACFADMGASVRLDPVRDAGTALRGGRAMLKLGLERAGDAQDAVIDRWYPALLEAYGRDLSRHTVLFPGAMEAVAALKAEGLNVAICTNKPERLARDLLTDLGVLDAFAALIGADTLPVKKPHPEALQETIRRAGGDPARGILIGDTATDRNTARAAGLPCVLVEFGPGDEDIYALEPEATLAHFDDLPALALRLLERL